LGNNGQSFPFLIHSSDYLEIYKDGNTVGKYCGLRTGHNTLLSGDQILIKFHSDYRRERRGFLIYFNADPLGKFFS